MNVARNRQIQQACYGIGASDSYICGGFGLVEAALDLCTMRQSADPCEMPTPYRTCMVTCISDCICLRLPVFKCMDNGAIVSRRIQLGVKAIFMRTAQAEKPFSTDCKDLHEPTKWRQVPMQNTQLQTSMQNNHDGRLSKFSVSWTITQRG